MEHFTSVSLFNSESNWYLLCCYYFQCNTRLCWSSSAGNFHAVWSDCLCCSSPSSTNIRNISDIADCSTTVCFCYKKPGTLNWQRLAIARFTPHTLACTVAHTLSFCLTDPFLHSFSKLGYSRLGQSPEVNPSWIVVNMSLVMCNVVHTYLSYIKIWFIPEKDFDYL